MDSMQVNWEALDALVIDFVNSENLIEDSTPSSSPSSSPTPITLSSYHSRLLIRRVRLLLESGKIDAALDLLRLHAPSVLEDHRLLFRLQKQVICLFLKKRIWKISFNFIFRYTYSCLLPFYAEIRWTTKERNRRGSKYGNKLFAECSSALCSWCLSRIYRPFPFLN